MKKYYKSYKIPDKKDQNIGLLWLNPRHYEMEKISHETMYRLKAEDHRFRNANPRDLVKEFDEHFGL